MRLELLISLLVLLLLLLLLLMFLLRRPLQESSRLRRFKSDRDEIWQDCSTSNMRIDWRSPMWRHTFKMAAMTSFRVALFWRHFTQKSATIWWMQTQRLPGAYAAASASFWSTCLQCQLYYCCYLMVNKDEYIWTCYSYTIGPNVLAFCNGWRAYSWLRGRWINSKTTAAISVLINNPRTTTLSPFSFVAPPIPIRSSWVVYADPGFNPGRITVIQLCKGKFFPRAIASHRRWLAVMVSHQYWCQEKNQYLLMTNHCQDTGFFAYSANMRRLIHVSLLTRSLVKRVIKLAKRGVVIDYRSIGLHV